jgi:hypothetical protein
LIAWRSGAADGITRDAQGLVHRRMGFRSPVIYESAEQIDRSDQQQQKRGLPPLRRAQTLRLSEDGNK